MGRGVLLDGSKVGRISRWRSKLAGQNLEQRENGGNKTGEGGKSGRLGGSMPSQTAQRYNQKRAPARAEKAGCVCPG
jgi:hypothetical protein